MNWCLRVHRSLHGNFDCDAESDVKHYIVVTLLFKNKNIYAYTQSEISSMLLVIGLYVRCVLHQSFGIVIGVARSRFVFGLKMIQEKQNTMEQKSTRMKNCFSNEEKRPSNEVM